MSDSESASSVLGKRIREDLINKNVYAHHIPQLIKVKTNKDEVKELLIEGNPSTFNLELKTPTTLNKIYDEINNSLNPTRPNIVYTYIIINLKQLLHLNELRGDANEILQKLKIIFKDYIIEENGEFYLIISMRVNSKSEIFNKHGSIMFFILNELIKNLSEYINEETDKTDINGNMFNLVYEYGLAGEFVVVPDERIQSAAEPSHFVLKFNMESGTLMRSSYNREERILLGNQVFEYFTRGLQGENFEIEYTDDVLIINDDDRTYDVNDLTEQGINLYSIDNGIYDPSYTYMYESNLVIGTQRKINSFLPYLKFTSLDKNEQKEITETLKKYLKDTRNNIDDIKQYLELLLKRIDKEIIIKKINESLKNIELLKKALEYKRKISSLMTEENRFRDGQQKRPRRGGKKTKKNKKNNKKSKTYKKKQHKKNTKKHNNKNKKSKTKKNSK